MRRLAPFLCACLIFLAFSRPAAAGIVYLHFDFVATAFDSPLGDPAPVDPVFGRFLVSVDTTREGVEEIGNLQLTSNLPTGPDVFFDYSVDLDVLVISALAFPSSDPMLATVFDLVLVIGEITVAPTFFALFYGSADAASPFFTEVGVLTPAPDIGTWLMMVIGFALVACRLRRRPTVLGRQLSAGC